MSAFLFSALAVAIAEIGDRTQLLALLLAVRFRKPVSILAGILVATLANHGLAAAAGYHIADLLKGVWVQVAVGASFIAMAAWTLIPDTLDEQDPEPRSGASVFLTTLVSFFLVEIGDKTQIATVALAARFHSILLVTLGTTLGMMAANAPAVLFGEAATRIVPLKIVRWAAALFALLGAWTLLNALA